MLVSQLKIIPKEQWFPQTHVQDMAGHSPEELLEQEKQSLEPHQAGGSRSSSSTSASHLNGDASMRKSRRV